MLYVFGFEQLGVVVSDLYFVDPNPSPGQEGAERGVRLELRLLERSELLGGIYSAQPIAVGRPIWRVDLLESVESHFGSFDRTHHHPAFTEWEPCRRVFVPELSADPMGWLAARLDDIDGVLGEAGVAPGEVTATDKAQLRAELPELLASVRRLLARIEAGELAQAPAELQPAGARVSWL